VLAVHDLVSARAGRPVHAPVAFDLAEGDALLLRGANGSGKSTFLRTLAGFLRPAAGSASWQDRPLTDPAWPAALHWISHVNALKAGLTVRENLQIGAALAGGPADPVAAADVFDLRPLLDVPAGRLSQGQRRRAALARLVAVPRRVWLLDEPGVGLDAANRQHLARLIDRHRAGGGIVVAASHGDVTLDDPLVLEL